MSEQFSAQIKQHAQEFNEQPMALIQSILEEQTASMLKQFNQNHLAQHNLIKECFMVLDHGDHDERLAILEKLEKYLIHK